MATPGFKLSEGSLTPLTEDPRLAGPSLARPLSDSTLSALALSPLFPDGAGVSPHPYSEHPTLAQSPQLPRHSLPRPF